MVVLADLPEYDQMFYEKAVQMAVKALNEDEVPVGCVFVYEGTIIGMGHNEVNKTFNPTMHAEIVAVERVTEWCQKNDKEPSEVFQACTLYVNLEPCCMCASALHQLKIKRVIFGASNERFGGMGSVMSNNDFQHDHTIDHLRNIDIQRSVGLLKAFYKQENPYAPSEKRKTRNKIPRIAKTPTPEPMEGDSPVTDDGSSTGLGGSQSSSQSSMSQSSSATSIDDGIMEPTPQMTSLQIY